MEGLMRALSAIKSVVLKLLDTSSMLISTSKQLHATPGHLHQYRWYLLYLNPRDRTVPICASRSE
jgi:hypothetical protein